MVYKFKSKIEIIGINPFVHLPEDILRQLFAQSGKQNGPIPVEGTINNKSYKQTLVKYSGAYRLYINTTMLKNSPKRIGEEINVVITFDTEPREVPVPPLFLQTLDKDKTALKVYHSLSNSKKNEIHKYLNKIKSEEVFKNNISNAIQFLKGEKRFIGRDKP